MQILLSHTWIPQWVPLETGTGGDLSVITLVMDLKFTGGRVGQLLQLGFPVLCELLRICGPALPTREALGWGLPS